MPVATTASRFRAAADADPLVRRAAAAAAADTLAPVLALVNTSGPSPAANAERPEGQVTLGAFEARLGRLDVAETAYRTAIELQPQFAPAYVNLADLQPPQ